MKKVLTILGGVFLILLLGVAVFVGYAAYQGQALDASSKAYVEQNVPPIVSTWSKDELLKRSSPQMLEMARKNPEDLDRLFLRLSKLGSLQSLGEVKGDSSVSYTTRDGKTVTASYVANARFEKGSARITVRIIQLSGNWQFLFFNVSSPLFLQ